MSTVRLSVEGHVARLVLDRPEKANAVTTGMAEQLREHVARINGDDEIRVAVITGSGHRHFCAGSDVGALDEFATPWQLRRRPAYTDYVRGVEKIMIAAVNGAAYGGGLELALSCDIRLCSTTARFAAPEVTLGWIGGGGMTALLAQSIGQSNTALMIATGRPVDAPTALGWGLVSAVHEPDALLAAADEIAGAIAANPPIATAVAKRNLRAAAAMGVDEAIRYERDLQTLCFYTDDAAEGRRAFAEKRPGTFRGR